MQALLGAWQVNGIVTMLSGRPFTPQYSAADISQQRPDRVGDPKANIPAGLSFNPAAFARPVATLQEPNLYGNAGRNVFDGPGIVDVDASVSKNWRLREGWRLEFRGEFFNGFNHPQFSPPNSGCCGGKDFGRVTGQYNLPRQIQFGLRFTF